MSGNPNFRDPAYRQRALQDRNNGHGKAHKSWNRKVPMAEQRERDAETCPFDKWLAAVKVRVDGIIADARIAFIRAQEGYDHGETIPF